MKRGGGRLTLEGGQCVGMPVRTGSLTRNTTKGKEDKNKKTAKKRNTE